MTSAGSLACEQAASISSSAASWYECSDPGDRIGEPLLVADLVVQPRRHAVVEHAHQRAQRHVAGIGLGQRVKQDVHLRLRRFVVHGAEARPAARPARARSGAPTRAARHAREGRAGLPHERCRADSGPATASTMLAAP